jgi:1-acyl-sn-glycerol-3-phosphate acyltransferase
MSINEFGFDDEFFGRLAPKTVRLLHDYYWRVKSLGVENVPADSGALLVANHSGTIPLDAAMVKSAVWFHENGPNRNVRILIEKFVYDLPFINVLFNRAGQVLACPENTLDLLKRGELVLVFPEGVKGISQPYSRRYRLQRFGRGGFVRMALEARVPIIPVAVVGAEEVYHVLCNFKPLASLLGVPYIPLTTTFPWLGPLGAVPKPTKWYIVFGQPLPVHEYPLETLDDDATIQMLSDRTREIIQNMLLAVVRKRRTVFSG